MFDCPFCRRRFAAHFVVEVFSKVRWRGNSFDAYQAQGKLGLAVAKALGVDATRNAEFARFVAEVSIRDFREKPAVPTGPFDPSEGERWEFHVGFAAAPTEDVLARAEAAAAAALGEIPNYTEISVRRSPTA